MPRRAFVRATLLPCALFVVLTVAAHGQEIGVRYSGKAEVPGLGSVVFPDGEWFLEFRTPPANPNPARRADYFGFRKVADTPERLGFRRYDPTTAPAHLFHCLDGLAENLGEGAPSEMLGTTSGSSTNYPMRIVPPHSDLKPTTNDIAYSFINVKPGRRLNWLCHTHLYSRDGWVFVVFHASPSVTDPDTVRFIS